MTYATTFACQIGTTNAQEQIGLEIWLDDLQIYNNEHIDAVEQFSYAFPDAEAEHLLRFVVKNKSPHSTKVDADGNIVQDVCAQVTNIVFDEIDVTQVITNLAEYTHDYNGTNEPTVTKFYGDLGCNGTVEVAFSTPIYLWLLEHM